jgi:tetratricopeptide (TPR) repeat protein
LRRRSILTSVECLALALTLALARPGGARAADPDTAGAREAFGEAERLHQLGRFEEAITAYERAYALDPQPAFLHNIALAHRRQFEIDGKAEHLRRARELYRNYLRLEPGSPRRAAIERVIEELGAKLEKEPAAPATVVTPPRVTAPPPAPDLIVAAPPPPQERRSHAGWWIAGGVAVAAAVVLGAVLLRRSGTDGPVIDLGGMPR